MQQGIKKLQWCEYLKVVFLEILNPLLCQAFANQVTYILAAVPADAWYPVTAVNITHTSW